MNGIENHKNDKLLFESKTGNLEFGYYTNMGVFIKGDFEAKEISEFIHFWTIKELKELLHIKNGL
jgi:hypothetical protein